MSLIDQKRIVRLAAQEKRRRVAADASPDAGAMLAMHVAQLVETLPNIKSITGFLPIGDEIDILPCLNRLRADGYEIGLPVVIEKHQPLVFRAWVDGDELQAGPLKTRHPLPQAPEITPDVLLVPQLAYDGSGYRIGWGGGFYDRTLASLKSNGGQIHAIGVAYDEQQIDKVPVGEFDVAVDWIVTEKRSLKIMKAGS